MAEEYGPDLITVLDDDGNEHQLSSLTQSRRMTGVMWRCFR